MRCRQAVPDTPKDPAPGTARWRATTPAQLHDGPTVTPTRSQREAEIALGRQAKAGDRRLIADWRATAPRGGAGATTGRASQRPKEGQAARQATSP